MEMDLRQYDPAIGRWTGIDPVTHHSMSTYTAFDNNPVFWADPSGANSTAEWMKANGVTQDDLITIYQVPEDDVTVNSDGVITDIVENDKPNRYFDENGNELFFHDSADVDKDYSNGDWSVGDRLYTQVTIAEMNQAIIDAGLIFERYFGGANGVNAFTAWIKAAYKSHNSYDFAENWLINLGEYKINSDNSLVSRSRASYTDDSGFFRFGNTNNIYNLYDGGNYMWGRAMRMSGFSYGEIRFGSQVNEAFTDTNADQRAIKNGFNSKKK